MRTYALAVSPLVGAAGCAWLCVAACSVEPGPLAALEVSAAEVSVAAATGDARWWSPGEPRVFPRELGYASPSGFITTLNLGGPTTTAGHAFFAPLGRNGRACVTCHQPADGMSLSLETIQERWEATGGGDPLFAAVDGSDCPSLPQADPASHSLLLRRGLFRIARPWPPRDAKGAPIEPEFTLEVVRDPTGCNGDPVYGLSGSEKAVSVYRRPRPATNLKYVTAVGFAFDPKRGLPMLVDPESGVQVSGNVMSDGRADTLSAQARDALRVHLALQGDPAPAQLAQILAFEQQLFSAASVHARAGALAEGGARGGPAFLSEAPAGALQSTASPIWSEFFPWKEVASPPGGDDAQAAFRRSVARGAELFSKRTFLVSGSAGITDIGFGDPVRNSCAFCHNMQHAGLDVAPGQVDIGTANEPAAAQANDHAIDDVPLFKLTCREDAPPHPHLGRVVLTHDPGYALTSGKCIDIGKITAQQLRGLAARAPYFSQGSAKTLRELVEFYDRRYEIELTDQEKDDLVHFLEVL